MDGHDVSTCSVGKVAARHVVGGEASGMGRWWFYKKNLNIYGVYTLMHAFVAVFHGGGFNK